MKLLRNFFSLVLITASLPNAFGMDFAQNSTNNCADAEYKRLHPYECADFFSVAAPVLSSATVLGGALALISLSNASSSEYTVPQKNHNITLPAYDMVGGDVESITLANISQTPEYVKNINQYNEIRLAYSLARGYTGKGTTIAVLDAGLDSWHGKTVAAIASGSVAPDAIVQSYKIANDMQFVSYNEIGNVIASADTANVFNASWSVSMRANDLRSRQQLIKLTDENFVNQLSNAAARDAIFVWAAGNDYSSQSSALSAIPVVMPEMRGHFINVVAWDNETGSLADFSNACGITSQWCITAPGTNIATDTTIATGTSFAAPIVSAAIAVIRESFPYMAAEEITNLLFETARDLGEPGVDAIYGHGMLDLERATRPVGAPLVPMQNGTMQALQPARISGTIAHNILSAAPKFAYFDKYGRAFNADLSDMISIQNPGLGFQRLRQNNDITITNFQNFEMGLTNTDIFFGDSFLQTRGNDLFAFIGNINQFSVGKIKLFQRARISFGVPKTTQNSMINNFSNIYMASIDVGANVGNWAFGVSIPDTIISGTMNLHLPTNRAANGNILYNDYAIDMRSKPAIEYSVSYKSITASFVDNPYGTDEFFIMTRGKIQF